LLPTPLQFEFSFVKDAVGVYNCSGRHHFFEHLRLHLLALVPSTGCSVPINLSSIADNDEPHPHSETAELLTSNLLSFCLNLSLAGDATAKTFHTNTHAVHVPVKNKLLEEHQRLGKTLKIHQKNVFEENHLFTNHPNLPFGAVSTVSIFPQEIPLGASCNLRGQTKLILPENRN